MNSPCKAPFLSTAIYNCSISIIIKRTVCSCHTLASTTISQWKTDVCKENDAGMPFLITLLFFFFLSSSQVTLFLLHTQLECYHIYFAVTGPELCMVSCDVRVWLSPQPAQSDLMETASRCHTIQNYMTTNQIHQKGSRVLEPIKS